MCEPGKDASREWCEQAIRMAYRDWEDVMGSLAGLRFGVHGFDDELEKLATEGLGACRPMLKVLERMHAHLGLRPILAEPTSAIPGRDDTETH